MLKEKNLKSNCLCEEHSATRQSNEIASHSFAMTEQCGRSMVEMLGVLAVIGVLSVAGIAGYNNAMNKHRANELLNEASKRAAIVAMQAAAGQNLNLGEFSGQPNADLFTSVVENPANTQQFQLTLSEVDEKVCTQMRSSVGTNTPIRDINSDCTLITYNKDLSTTVFASDYNADTTGKACTDAGFNWCSEASTPSCQADCCGALSQCQVSCNSTTGAITPVTDGTECDYSAEGANDGTCQSGVCEEKIEGKACYYGDNRDCGGKNSDYYCAFPSTVNQCPDASDPMKPSTGVGKCTSVNKNYQGYSIQASYKNGYLYNTIGYDWWSANAWCIAKGKSGLYSCSSQCNWSSLSSLVSGLSGFYWLRNTSDSDSCRAYQVSPDAPEAYRVGPSSRNQTGSASFCSYN